MTRDTLQVYQSRAAQRRFLGGASGPAQRLSREAFRVDALPLSEQVTAARFRAVMPQVITATASGRIQIVDYDGTARDGSRQPRVNAETQHWTGVGHLFVLGDSCESPSVLVADTQGSVAVYSVSGNGRSQTYIGGGSKAGASPAGMVLDTAFRAAPMPRGTRVCADVLPVDGLLLYSAEPSRIVKFNIAEERMAQQINTINMQASRSYLTSLRCDAAGTKMFCGGFNDGSVRYYDARAADSHQVVQWLPCRGSSDPIVDLWIRSGSHHVYVGHASGTVKVWDLRSQRERKLDACRGRGLTGMMLHHTFPVVVCGRDDTVQPAAPSQPRGQPQTPQQARLEFFNTKNEQLGELSLPLRSRFTMSLHPYTATALADRHLVHF